MTFPLKFINIYRKIPASCLVLWQVEMKEHQQVEMEEHQQAEMEEYWKVEMEEHQEK